MKKEKDQKLEEWRKQTKFEENAAFLEQLQGPTSPPMQRKQV